MTNKEKYIEHLIKHPSIKKKGVEKISKRFGISIDEVRAIHRGHIYNDGVSDLPDPVQVEEATELMEFISALMRGDISYKELKAALNINPVNSKQILSAEDFDWMFIPDLHEPFCDKAYFEWILRLRDKYRPTKIIQLGDLLDNYNMSFHDKNPNAFSATEEYEKTMLSLDKWKREFPEMIMVKGNHTSRYDRKAAYAGLINKFMKPIEEVYEFPEGWDKMVSEYSTNLFVAGHGDDGMNILQKIMRFGKSYIQGHYHSKTSLNWVSESLWGMQLGFGGDKSSLAFEYAGKGAKHNIHSVGFLIDSNPLIFTKR